MHLEKFVRKQVKDYTNPSFKHGPRVKDVSKAREYAEIDAGCLKQAMEVGAQNSYTMDPYETTYGKHCKPCGKLSDLR